MPDAKAAKEEQNIFQRMAAVTAELQTVGKNLTVGFGSTKYKAVGERDVLDAVKPLEAQHGIYSYPFSREIVMTDTLSSTGKDGKEITRFLVRIATKYRFVNVDKPDEHIDIDTVGDGIDSGDKAPGKAMTYGDKYALLKAYKISTGEDPDQEASPENGYKRQGRSAQTKEGWEDIPPGETPIPCNGEGCKGHVWQWINPDGSVNPAANVALAMRQQFNGRCFCPECERKQH